MHSLLRLSCDAGSQDASHEKHKQVEATHFHQYQGPHYGLRIPVSEKKKNMSENRDRDVEFQITWCE